MQQTVTTFLECYDKMLQHSAKIAETVHARSEELVPSPPNVFIVSYNSKEDVFRIEAHMWGGLEYVVIVVPSSEFYKDNPEDIDLATVRSE